MKDAERVLEPCPFCGLIPFQDATQDGLCEHPEHKSCPLSHGLFNPKEWNTRTETQLARRVKALEEALRNIKKHYEITFGVNYELSTTWNIANKALSGEGHD